jgi:hypothetical protein
MNGGASSMNASSGSRPYAWRMGTQMIVNLANAVAASANGANHSQLD